MLLLFKFQPSRPLNPSDSQILQDGAFFAAAAAVGQEKAALSEQHGDVAEAVIRLAFENTMVVPRLAIVRTAGDDKWRARPTFWRWLDAPTRVKIAPNSDQIATCRITFDGQRRFIGRKFRSGHGLRPTFAAVG